MSAKDTEALKRLIGQRLTRARLAMGFKQSEVAAAFAGLQKSHLSEWEAGLKLIPLPWLDILSRHYGVSADFLLARSERPDADSALREDIIAVSDRYIRLLADTLQNFADDKTRLIAAQNKALAAASELLSSFDRVRTLNTEAWEEMRAGVKMETAAEKFTVALREVETAKNKIRGLNAIKSADATKTENNPSGDLFAGIL